MKAMGEVEVEVEGFDVSPCCRNERFKGICTSLLLGQVLSLCLCGTGVTSELLSSNFKVDTPTAQSFLNYFLLACVYATILACRPAEFGIVTVCRNRGWKYALLALIDVEANFLVVKAYQYTNLISIQLLDCFTIPVVLLLSFFLLRTRYLILHVVGVFICLVGVAFVVWGDIESGKAAFEAGSNRLLGDVLCLLAATLYGVSNVAEEYSVKSFDRIEYLGMVGLFGSVISGIQLAILDKDSLGAVQWNDYRIYLLYGGFALCMFTFYSLVTLVIQRTGAAFFNMSILTADFYSVIAGIVIFKYQINYFYFISFGLVVVGTVVYSLRPTRVRSVDNSTVNSPDSEVVGAIENRFTQEPVGLLPSNGLNSISQLPSRDSLGGTLKRRSQQQYMSIPTMENSPVHIIIDSHPSATSEDQLNDTSEIPNVQQIPPAYQRVDSEVVSGATLSVVQPQTAMTQLPKISATSQGGQTVKYCPKHGVVYVSSNNSDELQMRSAS